MLGGRRPESGGLKVISGNPGKRPINHGVSLGSAGAPKAPKCLDAEGRKEWRRVAPLLAAAGVVTPGDCAILAGYCQAWSQWVEAQTALREYGRLVVNNRGLPEPSPWLGIAASAQSQILKTAFELGLTPMARGRIKPLAQGKVNPFAAIVGSR
jgi:P27 family predicted phage terminase small subunit